MVTAAAVVVVVPAVVDVDGVVLPVVSKSIIPSVSLLSDDVCAGVVVVVVGRDVQWLLCEMLLSLVGDGASWRMCMLLLEALWWKGLNE